MLVHTNRAGRPRARGPEAAQSPLGSGRGTSAARAILRPWRLRMAIASVCLLLAPGCATDVAPVVEATALGDTRDPLGPYTVTARVVVHRGLDEVRLFYRDAGDDRPEVVVMEEVVPGRFEAAIPGRPAGAHVHWFIEAEDIHGNLGYAPPSAEWGDESCVEALPPEAPVPEHGAAYCFSVLH